MSARVVSVGSADEDDVAILQISPADFPAEIPEGLPIEKGPGFRVGHEVYVLGNPLRLKDVYTRGVIMKVENGRALMDVEVAPGSSGGPVCDNRGVVVGIATAYAESGRTNLGLGVAIPTSSAWRLIDRISHGHAN